MKARIALFLALAVVFAATANEANYQPYAVGERAAGMGGAVCAGAGALDAAFYNPAGLARTDRSLISISASLYGFQRARAENGLFHGQDLEAEKFLTVPTAVGTVRDLGEKSAFAFAAFVPLRFSRAMTETSDDRVFSARYTEDDQTLWIGPAYARQVSPNLSLGAAVFAVYRTYDYGFTFYRGDLLGMQMESYEYSSLDALAQVGLQFRPRGRWSFGVMVQTPSVALSGRGEDHQGLLQQNGVAYLDFADDLDVANEVPPRVLVGAAWGEERKYGVEVDLSYHFGNDFNRIEGTFSDGTPAVLQCENDDVVDVSVGAEYYFRDKYPLRAGFFTSFSSAPDADPASNDLRPQIDLYGLTASVGSESENLTVNLGMNYVFGSGDGYGWDPAGSLTVTDADESSLYVVASSSYKF